MLDDFRYALRNLRQQWRFAAVAVATLVFGIGVNVTLFSMFSELFLQPLNVKDGDKLVLIMQRRETVNVLSGHSYPDYRDYRDGSTAFSHLVSYMPTPAHVSAPGQTPERTWIEVVSPNYFALAAVTPAFGEFPRPGQGEAKGDTPTIILSYRYWQRRFGGDPSLVNRPITVNGKSFIVAGIAPADFTGLSWAMAVSAFVPVSAVGALLENGDAVRDSRATNGFRLIGRLTPGKTVADARAEIEVVAKRLAAAYPVEHEGTRVLVVPENRSRPEPAFAGFLPVFAAVFAAMVALVLLIACANVANLMFSRAVARQRDLVIRSALGASRFRLVRLQLVESLVLAALAGLLGMILAQWTGQLLAALMPVSDVPIVEERPTDWRVYVFTVVVSVAAGLVTGLWPARKATRFELAPSLRSSGGLAATSRHGLRNLLVIGQVAMSLVVLASAGLFLHSFRQMQTLALGFEPNGLLVMSMDLDLQQYDAERGRRFFNELVSDVAALPGVEAVTTTSYLPFDYAFHMRDVAAEGGNPDAKDGFVSSAFAVVGSSFFQTTGVRLVRGRTFDSRDSDRSVRVAVINETMARRFWPNRDAIGQRFRFGRQGPWIEVVGIAADGKYVMLAEGQRMYFYLPLSQEYRSPMTLMVRSASAPASLVQPVLSRLGELDANLPVFNVRTMEAQVRDSVFGLMPVRIAAGMAAGQGVIALLLAVMGLYAVVSYGVTRRIREIGIRMALGANRRDVLRLVLREGVTLSLIGIVIGLVVASAVGLLLSNLLYGLAPADLGVLATTTVLVFAISLVACVMPARRATESDPLIALRYD